MKTEHMEYILEVARCRSISAAAKRLYMGQTTLSAIVNAVERELNIKIFQRTHKGVRLTPDGEAAIAMMEDISNKSAMLHSYCSTKQQSRRTMHLAFHPTACYNLALYLGKLYFGREDVVLSIHSCPYYQVISRVFQGIARIGVSSEASTMNVCEAEASIYGLNIEKAYTDKFYLVVNRNSPYAQRSEVEVPEIYGQHLALGQDFPTVDSPMGRIFRSFTKFTVFANNQIIKHAVVRTDMVAILQGLELLGDPLLVSGALIAVPLTGFFPELLQYIVYNAEKEPCPIEQALLDDIRAYYRALPPSCVKALKAGLPAPGC